MWNFSNLTSPSLPNPSNKSITEDGAVGEFDEIALMVVTGALFSSTDNKSPLIELGAGLPIDTRSKRISAPAFDGCVVPETDMR